MKAHSKSPNGHGKKDPPTLLQDVCIYDRRETVRGKPERAVGVDLLCEIPRREKRGKQRTKVDPTTCELEYNNDEIQLMKAMDQYKRDNRRQFPTWSETLEVLRALGYRRVAEPTRMPGLSTGMPPKVKV
jgi:hypothetical protein